jgi:hypothetical protein
MTEVGRLQKQVGIGGLYLITVQSGHGGVGKGGTRFCSSMTRILAPNVNDGVEAMRDQGARLDPARRERHGLMKSSRFERPCLADSMDQPTP